MYFRRFIVFLSVILLIISISIRDESITRYCNGVYSVYNESGDNFILSNKPLLKTLYPYERVDVRGNFNYNEFLNNMNAVVVKKEKVCDYYIIYGYSPKIYRKRLVNNEIINIMIAVKDDNVTIGSPLIMGGY